MAFPKLINQYHSRNLIGFIIALNSINKKSAAEEEKFVTKKEFKAKIKNIVNTTSPNIDKKLDELIQEANENGIITIDDSKIYNNSGNCILPPMTIHEKIYLKNILRSPYALLFLDKSVIDELGDKLSDVPDMYFDEMIDFKGVAEDWHFDEEFIKKFRLIIQAIKNHRKINFRNIDAHRKIHKNEEIIPFRIEYSVITRHLWLSAWNHNENRPFKSNISRMSDIKLSDSISDEENNTVLKMLDEKKEPEPIVMHVTNEKDAIERICLLFSTYHKKTVLISDDKVNKKVNEVEISLYYYNFDENEIIDNIMSFGKSVHVLSPKKVVDKIKERLRSGL